MKTDAENLIASLINQFTKLPGVGLKTAGRYAYRIIDMNKAEADEFVKSILDVKQNVKYCEICGNFTKNSPCENCKNASEKTICVVAYPKDVLVAQKIRGFSGSFHVLHGTISPLEGRGPDDIRIKQLLKRIGSGNVEEVLLALNPDVEGEATSLYLAKILKPLGIKTTRLAQGISMGTDLEYADELTLEEAFKNRKEM